MTSSICGNNGQNLPVNARSVQWANGNHSDSLPQPEGNVDLAKEVEKDNLRCGSGTAGKGDQVSTSTIPSAC